MNQDVGLLNYTNEESRRFLEEERQSENSTKKTPGIKPRKRVYFSNGKSDSGLKSYSLASKLRPRDLEYEFEKTLDKIEENATKRKTFLQQSNIGTTQQVSIDWKELADDINDWMLFVKVWMEDSDANGAWVESQMIDLREGYGIFWDKHVGITETLVKQKDEIILWTTNELSKTVSIEYLNGIIAQIDQKSTANDNVLLGKIGEVTNYLTQLDQCVKKFNIDNI